MAEAARRLPATLRAGRPDEALLANWDAAKDHVSRSRLIRWLLLRPEEAAAKAAASVVLGGHPGIDLFSGPSG